MNTSGKQHIHWQTPTERNDLLDGSKQHTLVSMYLLPFPGLVGGISPMDGDSSLSGYHWPSRSFSLLSVYLVPIPGRKDSKVKITYTIAAQAELAAFGRRQQSLLEEVIKSRKYVFGDDVIEITASDIRDAERYIRPVNLDRSRHTFMRRVVLQAYFVGGILTILSGLFYPYIRELVKEKPEQLMVVVAGVTLTMTSLFMQFYMKYRDDRRKQMYHETMMPGEAHMAERMSGSDSQQPSEPYN